MGDALHCAQCVNSLALRCAGLALRYGRSVNRALVSMGHGGFLFECPLSAKSLFYLSHKLMMDYALWMSSKVCLDCCLYRKVMSYAQSFDAQSARGSVHGLAQECLKPII